jgi:hypothetical protein
VDVRWVRVPLLSSLTFALHSFGFILLPLLHDRVLQLVVVRSCTALAAGWCYAHGTYGEGHLNLSQGFVWVTLCNACSQGENY